MKEGMMKQDIIIWCVGLMLAAAVSVWAQPANDECANAISLTEGVPVSGTNVGATGTDITTCGSDDHNDVWYAWTPTVSGRGVVAIEFSSTSFRPTVAVFDACGGTELICSDPNYVRLRWQSFSVTAGQSFRIRVAGENGTTGTFDIQVLVFPPPTNDECANAISLTEGVPVSGYNYGATGTDIASCAAGDVKDVWYVWTPTESGYGEVKLNRRDGLFRPTVAIFDACGGAELACGEWDSVYWAVRAGQTYWIRVAGWYDGSVGAFDIRTRVVSLTPVNDECANAIAITTGVPVTGNTAGAFGTEIASCSSNDSSDVWYVWTPEESGDGVVWSFPPTPMAVFDACGGVELACSTTGNMFFPVTAGSSYWIRVGRNPSVGEPFELEASVYAPLANDECANAIPLTTGVPEIGNTYAATGTDITGCGYEDTYDVWYVWTPEDNGYGTIRVTKTGGNISGIVLAGSKDGCGGPFYFCQTWSMTNVVSVHATAGQPLWLRVAGAVRTRGSFTIRVDLYPSSPPHDDCANAIPITTGVPVRSATFGATGMDPSCSCCTPDDYAVWFVWTPEESGTGVASTCDNTDFDTTLSVFDHCGGTELACDTNACGQYSRVTFPVTAGQSYKIRVAGEMAHTTGDFELLVSYLQVPDVVNLRLVNAEVALTAAGYTVGTVTTQCDEVVRVGRVISQTPAAGTSAEAGSPVDLVISSGPCDAIVPNLVGLARAVAGLGLALLGAVTLRRRR